MDDTLSSLGLTAVTLYQPQPNAVNVWIKRPYKSTLTYQCITSASFKRLDRLASSGSVELVQVPNSRQEAYFLFYWQKRFPIQSDYPSLAGINQNQPPESFIR